MPSVTCPACETAMLYPLGFTGELSCPACGETVPTDSCTAPEPIISEPESRSRILLPATILGLSALAIAFTVLAVAIQARKRPASPREIAAKPQELADKPVSPPAVPPVRQPQKQSAPPSKPPAAPAWIKAAEKELQMARQLASRWEPEPLQRPELTTRLEHQNAQIVLQQWEKQVVTVDDKLFVFPIVLRNPSIANVLHTYMPRTMKAWRREWLLRESRNLTPQLIELRAMREPDYRPLVSAGFRDELQIRAPWETRKELYREFAKLTGERQGYSLIHPFDHFPEDTMRRIIHLAEEANKGGLGTLSQDDRLLLLSTGAHDWFEGLLQKAK